MLASLWLWLALLLMAADWVATGLKAKRLRLLTKPGALLLLILWFSVQGGWQGRLVWFGLGLVFSLLGDIFLLGPDRAFLFGLIAFLVGHLCYIVGFNSSPFRWNVFFLLPLVAVMLVCSLIGRHILLGLRRGITHSRMKGPILGYMAVISLMLLSALASFYRPGWPFMAAALSSAGALSFFLSDSILASDRFVRQRWWAGASLMVFYHLGQVLIAGGALLALR